MNNKRIERLIPKAIKYFHINFEKFKHSEDALNKVYQGYIASFGPTVISSGIIQAVAFNSDKDKDNIKVMRMFFELLKEETQVSESNLLDYIKNNNTYYAKNLILEISIASKLAIRTFKLED